MQFWQGTYLNHGKAAYFLFMQLFLAEVTIIPLPNSDVGSWYGGGSEGLVVHQIR